MSQSQLGVICQPVDVLAGDARKLVAQFRSIREHLKLVVIDTLSRSIPGKDENSQEVMSQYVCEVDRVREELEVAVMIVHHENKGGGHMRGSTVLHGATDTEIRVQAIDHHEYDKAFKAVVRKQKDGEEGLSWSFGIVRNPETGGATNRQVFSAERKEATEASLLKSLQGAFQAGQRSFSMAHVDRLHPDGGAKNLELLVSLANRNLVVAEDKGNRTVWYLTSEGYPEGRSFS